MLVLELIAVHLMRRMETRLTFMAENAGGVEAWPKGLASS
jgi:hypothetical protein